MGFDRRGKVDLQLAAGETCQRAERVLEARLEPGMHQLVLQASATDADTLIVMLVD
jgi:hypothetical protein